MAVFDYITSFLSSIFGFFETIYNFIVNFIQGLVSFFTALPTYLSYISQAISGLPDFLVVFATAIIAIAVIHIILEVI